ncbi:alpha/beta hydrolase family protein [Pseudomonas brenneri]|uniref:alpha/beta hydrolase family protein n=1 Tax=Pseudomonas brenneri TaxID=129817 RepID=UPI003570D95C
MQNALYKIFKKPFFGRFSKPWRWPESVDQAQWTRLNLKSQSGADISALIALAHTPSAKGAILMVHPMGVIAKGFWMKYGHAEILREAGYHVMVFDLNGFGESTSTTMDFPLDVLAAGQELKKLHPDLPVAVFGASMGAAMSVCAMAYRGHPFKAAILESAFPTLLHFWSRYPIPKLGIQLSKLVCPAGELRLRPTEAAKNLVGNPATLLIYGEADEFTPVKDGLLLQKALDGQARTLFWQVPNAAHTHAFAASPEEYKSRVVDFLDTYLLRA